MRKPRASSPRRAARRLASRSPTLEPKATNTDGPPAMRTRDYRRFHQLAPGRVEVDTPGPPPHTEWRFIHNMARRRTDDKRSRILQAAVKVFARRGYFA